MLRLHVVSVHIPGATGFGPSVHLSVCFRGTSRRTRVVPEERSPTWNEELVWSLDECPLSPTDTLSLRLQHWDHPLPRGDLGGTTVSLDQLVANPSLPMACRDVLLLDHWDKPTGCTITFRCYYTPCGKAGNATVTPQGWVALLGALETLQSSGRAPVERKEDFQVRVRIIQARQLQGNDIRPVVKVLIGKRHFRTRSQTGNNPYFNEVFCQNFHETPEQLVAQPIRIQVLRSQNLCTKAVIGTFELDIGTVYSAPGRTLSWQWLSLQHPQHHDSHSRGYLQVSLAVRRAGERVQEVPSGDEDVKSNLLRPPPCATTLQIRVYCAQDLPQVEPARPCLGVRRGSGKVAVRVSFAGRTLCTRVMLPSANPEWNEVFFFPLRLPPICEEIQLDLLRGSCRSKVLGTATIHLSQIYQDPEELQGGTPGFLPCFGPAFLPLYGPRPDCARDLGVDYRGRVLLEICTSEGTPDERQRDIVAPVDVERAQQQLPPRCQWGLCGVFYSATMVPEGPDLLGFELGIGHDSSATPLSPPVFDGNLYHHLPWHGDKPVVAVTSSWEDNCRRWDTLNLLRTLCRRLERNTAELRRCRGDTAKDVGVKLLWELEQDCKQALAQLEAQPTPLTALDEQLRNSRRLLLRHLWNVAKEAPVKAEKYDWDTLVSGAERWLRRVAALAVEPQAGVPNLVLWLLQGQRRVGCAHVPVTDVTFSPIGPDACGRLCGKMQTIFLGSGTVRAQVRVRLWLCRVCDSGALPQLLEGSLQFHTETYENQTRLLGKWGPWKLLGRPPFSDGMGREGLPPGKIQPPKGWRWEGPWNVELQPREMLDTGSVVCEMLQELNGNQIQRSCSNGTTSDTDPGAVSEDEPWQSECFWPRPFRPKPPGSVLGGALCRRRRWHRGLVLAQPTAVAPLFLLQGVPDTEDTPKEDNPAVALLEPWGSQPSLEQPLPFILCTFPCPSRFQLRCYLFRALDLTPGISKTSIATAAHVSIMDRSQRSRVVRGVLDPLWEQTLLLHPVLLFGNPQGVREDPPAVVVEVFDQAGEGAGVFLGRCVCTPEVWLDLGHREPPWLQPHPLRGPWGPAGDLVAAFELLLEPEDGTLAVLTPPPLRKDVLGIPLGIRPRLQRVALEVLAWGLRGLRGAVREPRLELQWEDQTLSTPVIKDFASNPNFPTTTFLLTLALPEEEQLVPPIRLRVWDRGNRKLEVLVGQGCVRGLGQYRCRTPGLEQPPHQEQPPGPGDTGTGSYTVVSMPDEPLSLLAIFSLWKGLCSHLLTRAWARIAQILLSCLGKKGNGDKDMEEEEEEVDWWSKFYTALEDKGEIPWGTNRDRLKIYGCELEAVPEFQGLQDFCQTFPLHKPGGPPMPGQDPEPVGEFKGLFCIYPLPEEPRVPPSPQHFQQLPPSKPQDCLVRVYIVRAFDLSPCDVTGLSDPYVRVSLGKRTLGQRDQYVPNTLEPVFGRMFEMTATIPLEKDLKVTLLDRDRLPPDQEIGSTSIDLENRLLSNHRAHCGLPTLHHTAGPAAWRDQLCPSRTLELVAVTRGLPTPEFSPDGLAVTFNHRTFLLRHFESGPPTFRHPGPPRERLALHVLNLCPFVPEHLETRSLYNSAQPGLEQGKLQMWVDIFPSNLGPPGPPVNIDPRKAERYELRCVVWNVRDTDLGDTNLLGQRMSDIYVTGWLDGLPEQRQHTDIHYRSQDGHGAFNWRFLFPFEFLAAEKLCVIGRREHVWSLDKTVLKVPPKLILQVWDNDKFKADDLLGVLELDLTKLPYPALTPRLCRGMPWEHRSVPWPWCRTPALAPSSINLFRMRRARGWWPCTMQEDGAQRLSGKLELSLELLTAEEAEERPVGKGREEPNNYPTLPVPRRSKSSFLWLQSPLRLLRYGIRWRYCGWAGLALVAVLLLFLMHIFFPSSMTVKMVDQLRVLHPAGAEHPKMEHPPGRGAMPA
ncbi:fer-1-like protein 5 isoform X2 [Manacus candei]|uniref:fer-1-like protein 5 isoform X2 n=1 Tax=Manacus candei TaxID=415023 RepID=UPI0022265541|nr:fer-1-like protein 5 isoform X2 [Manacus candei]